MLLRVLYAQIHWNWNHLRKTVLKTQEYLTRDHTVCPVLPLDVFMQTSVRIFPVCFPKGFREPGRYFVLNPVDGGISILSVAEELDVRSFDR